MNERQVTSESNIENADATSGISAGQEAEGVSMAASTATASAASTTASMGQLKWSGQRRVKFFITGVAGPITCLTMAWFGFKSHANDLWQSGQLDVYAGLMLEWPSLVPFLPLLVLSMVALGTICWDPCYVRLSWVRLGLYGGALLSIQYLIAVIASTSLMSVIVAAMWGPALALVVYVGAKLSPLARRVSIWQLLQLTTAVAVVVALAIRFRSELSVNLVLGAIFWFVVAVPTLNCITYVRVAVDLWLQSRKAAIASGAGNWRNRFMLFAIPAWIASWVASWKFAIDITLEAYSNLPTSPPNCYVSAAAACGHERFVGVTQFRDEQPNGNARMKAPVNLQMCRLKFLEIALEAAVPTIHRGIRRAYNAVGPHAAAVCCRSKWFADASYVMLKPLEWLAELLRIVAGVSSRRVRRLYGTASAE